MATQGERYVYGADELRDNPERAIAEGTTQEVVRSPTLVSTVHLVIAEYTTAGRPVPSATAPQLIRVRDVGSAEQVQICLRDSTGAYEWVVIGIASV
jgi:hypothetical protein